VIDSSSERGAFKLLEGKKEFQLDEGGEATYEGRAGREV
jgi:hypothetical protein